MMTASKKIHFVSMKLLTDVLAIIASVLLAYYIRFVSGLIPAENIPDMLEYLKALIVIVPVYLVLFREYGLYTAHRHIRRIEEIFEISKAVTFSFWIRSGGG